MRQLVFVSILLCLSVFSLCLSFSSLFAQWEADRKLSSIDTAARLNENMGQCLAVNGDSIHIVWCNNQPGRNILYYKHSFDGGTTWSDDIPLVSSSTTSPDFPSIAVSGATVHVAYRDTLGGNGEGVTYYKRSLDGGNTWETSVSLGIYHWWPSIACVGERVFIALNDSHPGNTEVYFRRSTDNGTTWDSVKQISNAAGRSEDPSITASDGHVYMAWNDNRTGIMQTWYRHSSDWGTTWGDETQMTNAAQFAYFPFIHAVNNDVDLLWGNRTGSSYTVMYKHSSDHGATWSEEQALSNEVNATSAYPTLVRRDKNVHVTWFDFNSGVYYRRSNDGGSTWIPALQLVTAASNPGSPFIGLNNTALHLIWLDHRDGYSAIYYTRNLTGNSTNASVFENHDPMPGISVEAIPGSPNRIKVTGTISTIAPAALKIFNSLGAQVFSESILSVGYPDIDCSSFTAGLYFVSLESGNSRVVQKFVITQ